MQGKVEQHGGVLPHRSDHIGEMRVSTVAFYEPGMILSFYETLVYQQRPHCAMQSLLVLRNETKDLATMDHDALVEIIKRSGGQ